ncbi:hypothetical protein J537_1895 [Acinetobacter baumannii 1437282]|nr:hypothetical protein J537_1895 [Acinetobacter baumannii 1437282]
MALKTLIPLLAPFFTIFLGIIALPLIEKRKKDFERKRLLKALIEEVRIQILLSDINLKKLSPVLDDVLKIMRGQKLINAKLVYPGEIKYYTLEKLLEDHYADLDSNSRIALKHLKEIADGLNEIDKSLNDLYMASHKHNKEAKDSANTLYDQIHNYISLLLYNRYNLKYAQDILTKGESELKSYTSIEELEAIEHELNILDQKIVKTHFSDISDQPQVILSNNK